MSKARKPDVDNGDGGVVIDQAPMTAMELHYRARIAEQEGIIKALTLDRDGWRHACGLRIPAPYIHGKDAGADRSELAKALRAVIERADVPDHAVCIIDNCIEEIVENAIPDDGEPDADEDGERYSREADGPPTPGALLAGRCD